MIDVLRKIGHVARVRRYGFSGEESRCWLPVAMDGLPYGLTANIVENTFICCECSQSGPGLHSYYGSDWDKHLKDKHSGDKVKSEREFDWIVFRIGPLHFEMNMVKTLFAMNWDVTICELAKEMGFASENALSYAKTAKNDHHSMALLEILLKGGWCELLLPYIRERIQCKGELSINDYLYNWMPRVVDPNYMYQFELLWRYIGAVQVYHMGIRRNNAEYFNAGMLAFAPFFSCKPYTSKYQMIELQDR